MVVAGDAGVCALLPGLVAGGVRSCTGCWGGVEGCCEVGVCGVVDDGGAAGFCGVVCASACCCCAWAPMESVINSAAAMNEPFRSFILLMRRASRTSKVNSCSIRVISRLTTTAENRAERYHIAVQSLAMHNGKPRDWTVFYYGLILLFACAALLAFFLTLFGGFLFLVLLLDAGDVSGDGVNLHFRDRASRVANIERVNELPVFAL